MVPAVRCMHRYLCLKIVRNAHFGSGAELIAVDPHGDFGIHYIEIAFQMRRRKSSIFCGVLRFRAVCYVWDEMDSRINPAEGHIERHDRFGTLGSRRGNSAS